MNDYKRLRKAAQVLIDKIEPDIMLFPWRWLTELTALRNVLADTPEESEMERLKAWLEQRCSHWSKLAVEANAEGISSHSTTTNEGWQQTRFLCTSNPSSWEGKMRVRIAIGWPTPADIVWDDEVTPETLGGIIDAFLVIPKTKVLVWRTDSPDTEEGGEDASE